VLLNLVKWSIIIGLFIIGCNSLYAIHISSSVNPFIITIFSFGAIFIIYNKGDANVGTLLTTVAVVLASAASTLYVYVDWPIMNWNIFFSWWLWSLAIGWPAMFLAFKKFDD
jgi:hypothetical protein